MNQSRHDSPWIGSDRISKKKSNDEIFPFYQFYQLKRKTIHSIYQKKKCQFFSYSKNKTIFQWQDQLQFFAKVSISQCDHDLFNVCHTCNQIHSRWQRENWTEFFLSNFTLDTYFMRLWWKKEKLTMTESDNGALWSNRGGNWDTILAHFRF